MLNNIHYRISDMMNEYADERVQLPIEPITTPGRIERLTMQRLALNTPAKKTRRLGRTLLAAAAALLALSAAAFAAFHFSLEDMTLAKNEPDTLSGEQAVLNDLVSERATLSLNGLSDSAEYQAYLEWNDYLARWDEEHPDPWGELGVDDTWHETPDNYLWYYGASFSEQADALDAIAEKYGLSLHTLRIPYISESDLSAMLGVGSVWTDGYEYSDGYVYEDGSFLLTTGLSGGVTAETFLAADDSFTMIERSIAGDWQSWKYTTADGTTLLIAECEADEILSAMGTASHLIAARLDEAMVTIFLTGAQDRSQAEAIAEQFNFSELSRVFSAEGDRSGLAAAAAEEYEIYQLEQAERAAEAQALDSELQAQLDAYIAQRSEDEWDELYREELGEYSLSCVPEGQTLTERQLLISPQEYGVAFRYAGADGTGGLYFKYERIWSDDEHENNVTGETQTGLLEQVELHTIAGQTVRVSSTGFSSPILSWYDSERDLRFTLCTVNDIDEPYFSAEELLEIAEVFITSLSAS